MATRPLGLLLSQLASRGEYDDMMREVAARSSGPGCCFLRRARTHRDFLWPGQGGVFGPVAIPFQ